MIIGKKITKTYGEGRIANTVLKGVDLEIKSGEYVSIVGPSGAGKSTLLYQLSLLDIPTSGTIIVNKKNVMELSHSQRVEFRLKYFGFVFQDYALVPELTAIENVMLPLLMMNKPRNRAKQKSIKILKRLGFTKQLNNLPSQLSGGEQQRVSVARAMVNDPEVLFADEPTANLDTENSLNILKIFDELHKKGQTIIMITHEMDYAKRAGRLIYLRDGKVEKKTKSKN